MKFSLKWFSQYGWLVFFIFIFFIGISFIFWMGNVHPPTLKDKTKKTSAPITSPKVETDVLATPTYIVPTSMDNVIPSPAPMEETAADLIEEEKMLNKMEEKLENDELTKEETNELCPTLLIKRGNKIMLFNKNMPEIQGENPIFFDHLEQYVQYTKKQQELYGEHCPVLFLQEEVNAQGENVYKLRQMKDSSVDPLMLGSMEDYFQSKTNVSPKFKPPSGPDAFNKPPPNSAISLSNFGVPIQYMEQTEMSKHQPLVEYEDANRDNSPYNQGYYGFDPTGQYIGKYTVLDEIHDSTKYQNKDGLSNNPMDPNWGGALFTAEKVASGFYDGNKTEPPTVPTVLQN